MNKYILTDGNFPLLSQTLGCERINLVVPFFFNVTVITRGLGSLEKTLMVRGEGKCFIWDMTKLSAALHRHHFYERIHKCLMFIKYDSILVS